MKRGSEFPGNYPKRQDIKSPEAMLSSVIAPEPTLLPPFPSVGLPPPCAKIDMQDTLHWVSDNYQNLWFAPPPADNSPIPYHLLIEHCELKNFKIPLGSPLISHLLNFPNLSSLNINLSKFAENKLLPTIGCLTNLQRLELANNNIVSIPAAIGQLRNLILLDLKRNYLNDLPKSIGKLDNLTDLNASHNRIGSLPTSIGQLSNLHFLKLSNNQLTLLPPTIGQLSKLRILDLSNNRLVSLPNSIGGWTELQQLKLLGNDPRLVIDEFPVEFALCQKLELVQVTSLSGQANWMTEELDDLMVSRFEAGYFDKLRADKERRLLELRRGLNAQRPGGGVDQNMYNMVSAELSKYYPDFQHPERFFQIRHQRMDKRREQERNRRNRIPWQ